MTTKETPEKKDWIGELVRDITKVGSISKSEVKERINQILTQEKQGWIEEIIGKLPSVDINIDEDSLSHHIQRLYKEKVLQLLEGLKEII